MNDLKEQYNKTLKRYYNGCNYIFEHPKEYDKYLPEVLKLLDKVNILIQNIGNMTKEEIINGFEI